jgi:transposase
MGPHQPPPEKPKRERAGRQPLPEHLPRVEHRHEPEVCTCGQCGRRWCDRRGRDRETQHRPRRVLRRSPHLPQVRLPSLRDRDAGTGQASVIDGGLAAPALLAWVMVSKYADHLPLYRLERQAARSGVILSRSTLADWVGRIGVALEPLWRSPRRIAAPGARCCMPMKPRCSNSIRAKERPSGRISGLIAAMPGQADPPIVVFDYQPGRGGVYVVEFLGAGKGR